MKGILKNFTALGAAAVIILTCAVMSGCSLIRSSVKGDLNVLPRTYKLSESTYTLNITELENEAAAEIPMNIRVDEMLADTMVITTDDNIFSTLTVEIDEEEKVINIAGNPKKRYSPSEFEIAVGVPVSTLKLEGAYSLSMLLPTVKELELDISGAVLGEIIAEQASKITAGIQGAAELEFDGKSAEFILLAEGVAKIDASSLRTEKSVITLRGAATAQVYATESLEATVEGTASVVYHGHPREIKTDISGLGEVVEASVTNLSDGKTAANPGAAG